jgi:hypothetical protein
MRVAITLLATLAKDGFMASIPMDQVSSAIGHVACSGATESVSMRTLRASMWDDAGELEAFCGG